MLEPTLTAAFSETSWLALLEDIFTAGQLELREEQRKKQDELLEAIRAYFAARKPERKATLRATIDAKVIAHIRNHLEIEAEKVSVLIDQTEKFLNGTYPAPPRWTEKKGTKDLAAYQAKHADLERALGKLEETTRLPATEEEKAHLSTLASQCAAATASGDTATLAAREHEINQLVDRLFHLTPAEIALIEGSLPPDAQPPEEIF